MRRRSSSPSPSKPVEVKQVPQEDEEEEYEDVSEEEEGQSTVESTMKQIDQLLEDAKALDENMQRKKIPRAWFKATPNHPRLLNCMILDTLLLAWIFAGLIPIVVLSSFLSIPYGLIAIPGLLCWMYGITFLKIESDNFTPDTSMRDQVREIAHEIIFWRRRLESEVHSLESVLQGSRVSVTMNRHRATRALSETHGRVHGNYIPRWRADLTRIENEYLGLLK